MVTQKNGFIIPYLILIKSSENKSMKRGKQTKEKDSQAI